MLSLIFKKVINHLKKQYSYNLLSLKESKESVVISFKNRENNIINIVLLLNSKRQITFAEILN